MNIWIYALILIVLALAIGLSLDYLLIKNVFRLIIGKDKDRLDAEKLKAIFQDFMKHHRQKKAFNTYLCSVIALIGGGGVLPFHKAELFIANGKGIINFKLLVDNVPTWIVIIGLLLITIAYFSYMYFTIRKGKDDILHSAAQVINEQFCFIPTQNWFKEASERGIKNLGKTFDLNINFKYDFFEDAFASTCRDNRLAECFLSEKEDLLTGFRYVRSGFESSLGKSETQNIYDNITAIADALSFNTSYNNAIQTINRALKNINLIFHQAIEKSTIDYNDYNYSRINPSLEKIDNHLHNPWIQSIQNQTLIVYGEGGTGKTHLLAKIVQRRLEEKLPTIFFLGKLITNTSIPMEQMLGTLDLKCKKETFYRALDEYGQKHGRVLLVVDSINEGIGLSLWKDHLLNFLNEIQPYPNIGLIVSVRTNGSSGWIKHFIQNEGYPSYKHRGFALNTTSAVEYMFTSFSIPLPAWPIIDQEFRNPLLLTLFCRSHQSDTTPPKHETRLEIIENYIHHFNERLASAFPYSPSINILHDVLHDITIYMIEKEYLWGIPQTDLLTILRQHQTISSKADIFLDALLDEGILNEYDSLDNKKFYTFAYDTMGSYLIASTMVESNNINGKLLHDEGVIEALTLLLPAKKGKELFEVVKREDTIFSRTNMFLESLPMRTRLTATSTAFLQDLYDKRKMTEMFEIIARSPSNKDWPLNANTLDTLLKPMKLVERDAVWTIHISSNTDTKEQISTLVAWARAASQNVIANLDKDVLLLICRLLIWTLTTTDTALRDRTTRALINLLRNDEVCLLQCIKDYHEVNDDYIVERLFAIAFGCCTINQEKGFVEKVAQLTYDCVFKAGIPRENILIRDFAKNIIDYAISLNCNLDFEIGNILPPYSKEKKNIFVPTDEIKQYELDFENTPDKELYWAQMNIMESMLTENSSRGIYGDFGRYIFQATLDNWNDDIELISNYAIKLIFEEIGYNAVLFKKFDGKHSSRLRFSNKIERIGKKYQWIAMHRVAAILADNHYEEPYTNSWLSPIEVNVRNLDPTFYINPNEKDYNTTLPTDRVPEYDLSNDNDKKWLKKWQKMPAIKDYIEYELDGRKWINLHSYYTISSNTNYNKKAMDGKSERELWTYIQAFFLDEHDRKRWCNTIHKEGLRGRCSTENSEVSSIYYREYYWSDSYRKEIEESGRANRDFTIGNINTNINVQPSYLLYTTSEYSDEDSGVTESHEIKMPSSYLYKWIGMRFATNNGIWLTEDGNVACFDNYWVHGNNGGLMIRKDLLMAYLKDNNKTIVWPILIERSYKSSGIYWERLQAGGYTWMDKKGRFHHKFRAYEGTRKDKVKKGLKLLVKKPLDKTRSFLHNHDVLQQVSTESLWQMLENKRKRQDKS